MQQAGLSFSFLMVMQVLDASQLSLSMMRFAMVLAVILPEPGFRTESILFLMSASMSV